MEACTWLLLLGSYDYCFHLIGKDIESKRNYISWYMHPGSELWGMRLNTGLIFPIWALSTPSSYITSPWLLSHFFWHGEERGTSPSFDILGLVLPSFPMAAVPQAPKLILATIQTQGFLPFYSIRCLTTLKWLREISGGIWDFDDLDTSLRLKPEDHSSVSSSDKSG